MRTTIEVKGGPVSWESGFAFDGSEASRGVLEHLLLALYAILKVTLCHSEPVLYPSSFAEQLLCLASTKGLIPLTRTAEEQYVQDKSQE